MGTEEKISGQISEYQEIAKEEKGVDVAALAINALDLAKDEAADRRKRHRAYLVSFGLPPFGLIYAVIYAFNGKPDGRRVAIYCVIWTVVSLLLSWLVIKIFMSSLSPELTSQLQSVKPEDIQSLLQQ